MKLIPLTKGKFAKVDNSWFDYLSQWKWYCNGEYAERKEYRNGKQIHIQMHRVIMGDPDGLVDHENGEGFDNQTHNLRLANHSTNAMNMRKHRGASIYKGVSKHENSWRTQIWHNNKKVFAATFPTEIAAALCYDLNASALFGEYARLNFGDALVSIVLNDCAVNPQSGDSHTALS